MLNEEEPIHSFQEPLDDREPRYRFYYDEDHIIIHQMELIPLECGYTDTIYASDNSEKKGVKPMGKGSAIYGMSHDEKAAKLLTCAYATTQEAEGLCAHKEKCTCHWMINWDMD